MNRREMLNLIRSEKRSVKHLTDESKTSFAVAKILEHELGYVRFGQVVPQAACKRGFIDYFLRSKITELVVEVKPFNVDLKLDDIKKYLVSNGSHSHWRFGVLTNFHVWRLYIYTPRMRERFGIRKPLLVASISIMSGRHLNSLNKLVGRKSLESGLKTARLMYSTHSEVLESILCRMSSDTVRAIRKSLSNYKIVESSPHEKNLKPLLRDLRSGKSWGPDENTHRISSLKLARAIKSDPVVNALRVDLRNTVGVSTTKKAMKKAIEKQTSVWAERTRSGKVAQSRARKRHAC